MCLNRVVPKRLDESSALAPAETIPTSPRPNGPTWKGSKSTRALLHRPPLLISWTHYLAFSNTGHHSGDKCVWYYVSWITWSNKSIGQGAFTLSWYWSITATGNFWRCLCPNGLVQQDWQGRLHIVFLEMMFFPKMRVLQVLAWLGECVIIPEQATCRLKHPDVDIRR